MSRGANTSDSFVDTGLLRDHVSKLHKERNIACELYDNVNALKLNSDPSVAYQYDSILRDIKQLIEYFNKMAKVLNNTADDAIQLSREMKSIIKTETENVHRTSTKSYML